VIFKRAHCSSLANRHSSSLLRFTKVGHEAYTLLFTPLVCRGYLLPHTCSARPGFFNRMKATRAITNDRATPIANVICGVTSTTPARSTTCAPCTSKTISDGIIRGEPSSFIFLDRSLKGEQFGKLAVFHLGKPGVEVLRSRVCTATGQIAAPGHRPDRLLVGLCIVESSPIRYPVTRGCLGRPRRLGCVLRCRSCSASTRQARALCHLLQQSHQRAPSLTEHQCQQYDHEVLILGLAHQGAVALHKVTPLVIQAYNGDRHRTPSWSRFWIHPLDTTEGPFLPLPLANG
jgi:hypothetical protein